MKITRNRFFRRIVILAACFSAITSTGIRHVLASDFFINAATSPGFQRGFHAVSIGGYRTESAGTNDGQTTGISYEQFEATFNIWNNEHNQVFAGIQSTGRQFDRKISLPDGFAIPERLNSVSTGFLYRHITSGDWAISQGIRYTRSWTAAQLNLTCPSTRQAG